MYRIQKKYPICQRPQSPFDETSGSTITFPSLRALTIQDDWWQFLAQKCSSLQDITVMERNPNAGSRSLPTPLLDLKTLGKMHPRLKKLHCPEWCNQILIKGKFVILRGKTQLMVRQNWQSIFPFWKTLDFFWITLHTTFRFVNLSSPYLLAYVRRTTSILSST